MPKVSKAEREAEAARTLAQFEAEVAACIAAHPFSPYLAPTDPAAYANLSDAMQEAIAECIYASYKLEGKSAGECRAIYGGTDDSNPAEFNRGLSGHVRRGIFRKYPALSGAIAPSYVQYRDSAPRKGSAHARTHGEAAQARAAEAAQALEAERAAQFEAQAVALREAGKRVPRDPAKRAAAYAKLA